MSEDDSTDWLTTAAPYLDRFEDSLRCPICRELLVRAPSITECGHTFCGECIMRHFNSSEVCPVCRSGIQRGKLRSNKVVGDLADLWQSQTRKPLLELATAPQSAIAQSANNITENANGSLENHPDARPLDSASSSVEILSDSDPASQPPGIPPDHAQCPVCMKILPIAEIQGAHITKCLNQTPSSPSRVTKRFGSPQPPTSKRANRAVFGQEYPESKLAVPHFHSMSDTKLKTKAKEVGLSVKGSRQRIIARYMEWLTLWNSNVNDKHPRTVATLRKQISEWDKAQDRIAENTPSLKTLDAQEWSQQNSSSFADLIAKARAAAKPHTTNPE